MQPTHLVILIHGLYGTPLNLKAVKDELVSLSSNIEEDGRKSTSSSEASTSTSTSSRVDAVKMKTHVLVVESNEGVHTWDGIDVCAHRVAEEVDKEVERLQDSDQDVVGVSVMGYSLGGLIARYLIGILHSRQPSFFARHKPVSFSTAATPHLGQLKYGTRVNSIVHTVGAQMFSRTGKQLFLLDREPGWGGRSLLEVMADPDHVFIRALRQFASHLIVANGCNDRTVPYPSGSISLTDPFADLSSVHVETDDEHIVKSYRKVIEPDPESLPVNDIDVLDEDGEEVTISIKVIKASTGGPGAGALGRTYKGRNVQTMPPFWLLPLPWPLSHLPFLFFPFIIPIMLLWITGLFTYQTYRSRRRIRDHHGTGDRQPLLAPAVNAIAESAASATDLVNPDHDDAPSYSDTLRSSLAQVMPPSMSSSEMDGTSTPPLEEPADGGVTSTLLRLSPSQKDMISNLHAAMPRMKRVIAWFPWIFNSHAILICRDTKRFPWQEDGRGVVRAWAQFVVDSGADQLSNTTEGGAS